MAQAAHIGWTEPEFWAADPTFRQWVRHVEAENARVKREEQRTLFLAYTIARMSGKTLKNDPTFEEWANPEPDVVETEDGVETAGLKFNPGVSKGVASGIAQLVAVAKKDKSFVEKYGGDFEPPEPTGEPSPAGSYSLEQQHAAARAFEAQVRAVRRQKAQAKEEGGTDD